MNKVLSFLGLARRAGALTVGSAGAAGACRSGKGKGLAALAAQAFFQRVKQAPLPLKPRAAFLNRKAQHGEKGKVIIQGHTGKDAVLPPHAFAQGAVNALIHLKFLHP